MQVPAYANYNTTTGIFGGTIQVDATYLNECLANASWKLQDYHWQTLCGQAAYQVGNGSFIGQMLIKGSSLTKNFETYLFCLLHNTRQLDAILSGVLEGKAPASHHTRRIICQMQVPVMAFTARCDTISFFSQQNMRSQDAGTIISSYRAKNCPIPFCELSSHNSAMPFGGQMQGGATYLRRWLASDDFNMQVVAPLVFCYFNFQNRDLWFFSKHTTCDLQIGLCLFSQLTLQAITSGLPAELTTMQLPRLALELRDGFNHFSFPFFPIIILLIFRLILWRFSGDGFRIGLPLDAACVRTNKAEPQQGRGITYVTGVPDYLAISLRSFYF